MKKFIENIGSITGVMIPVFEDGNKEKFGWVLKKGAYADRQTGLGITTAGGV